MFCAISINKDESLLDLVYDSRDISVIENKLKATKKEDLSEDVASKIILHSIETHQMKVFNLLKDYPLSCGNRSLAIESALRAYTPEKTELPSAITSLLERGFTYFENAQELFDLACEKRLSELAERIKADTVLDDIFQIIDSPDIADRKKHIQMLLPEIAFCDQHYKFAAEVAIEKELIGLAAWLCSHIESDTLAANVKELIKHSIVKRHTPSPPTNPSRNISPSSPTNTSVLEESVSKA